VEQRTIQAAQAGDRDARGQILRWLADPWYRMALAMLGRPDDAADAVQEAGLRLLRQLPRFQGNSQFRTWAIGIALNVIREMRRKQHPAAAGNGEFETSHDKEAPLDTAQRHEEQQTMRELLHSLPDRQREAVILRYFEDLSVDDTAAAMGCAPGTVKACVHQALRSLRGKLAHLAPLQSERL
jgi:RNA polymerase sigma-70 factor (ECF subfamily)